MTNGKWLLIGLFLLVVFTVGMVRSAEAKSCTNDGREVVLEYMKRVHGEVPVGVGVSGAGESLGNGVTELLVSPTGSWTAIVTLTTGAICVVASGEDWQFLPPPGKGV